MKWLRKKLPLLPIKLWNAEEMAESLRQQLIEAGIADDIPLATFGSVIGTHLGEGSVALAYIPLV